MSVNEICASSESTAQKNTGGKDQCLEGAVRTYALAKSGFSFGTTALAKTKAAWDVAKAAKDIVVFYDIEELAANNTDAVIKNGRYRDYNIKDEIKGVDYTHNLSTCSHAALKSYEDSDYTTIFRITDNNELLCEVNDDGTVSGEPLSSLIVGARQDAPTDGTPTTVVSLKFDDYSPSIIIPEFDLTDYEGIFDLTLTLVSATATSIKFKANTSCAGTSVTSLAAADVGLNDAAGFAQTVTFVTADANGEYTLTGTGFANGFTLNTNGVVVQSLIMYEGESDLLISGI